mgnify:CR=1 FL=1
MPGRNHLFVPGPTNIPERIRRAIDVPLIADADTGYGNELNVVRTVRDYEQAGVAGIHIEDQVSPKRCGHLDDKEIVPREDMVCRATKKVHDEILASPLPQIPFVMSEFNASYANEPDVTDSVYMGPWIANMIRECDGYVDDMSYWTFSDVFEEQGIVKTPFYGGFGLIAERNIHKPAFNAFALLHRLGSQRLAVDSTSALATRTEDGRLVLALWNYAPPVGIGPTYHGPIAAAAPKHFSVRIEGAAAEAAV